MMTASRCAPWFCPQCGLEGDHLKSPDPNRCKTCLKVDAAGDLYRALLKARGFIRARLIGAGADAEARAVQDTLDVAIAKAEGRG